MLGVEYFETTSCVDKLSDYEKRFLDAGNVERSVALFVLIVD